MMEPAPRPFLQILVAVDLSAASEQVLRRTMLLPLAADASVEVLHVVPASATRAAESAVQRSLHERLDQLKEVVHGTRAVSNHPPVAFKTIVGQPYVEIIRHSRQIRADLVVLGRDRVGLPSTAIRVVRQGDVPVLVVAGEATHPYRRAVVGIDLTDASLNVVDLARRLLGRENGSCVSLLHAYHIPFEGWLREDGLGREFKQDAISKLERLHADLGESARRWTAVLRKGDPVPVVLDELHRSHADLVVLGTHGRSGVSHALVGSVAEWVLSEAPVDVAITRPTRYSFDLP